LRALEIQYGLLDYIKNSQVFTAESIQREVKYLQSSDRLRVSWGQNEYDNLNKSILNLMLAMNVDDKHRTELRTILNNTSQGHLAEYLSDYECKLIVYTANNLSVIISILFMLQYFKINFQFQYFSLNKSNSFTIESILLWWY